MISEYVLRPKDAAWQGEKTTRAVLGPSAPRTSRGLGGGVELPATLCTPLELTGDWPYGNESASL